MHSNRSRWLCGLAALSACLVVAPAADAKYGFKVSPRIGKTNSVFKISFIAPRDADGSQTNYLLEGIGPRRCPQLFEFGGRATRGKREVLRLTAGDDLVFANRTRWCRGTYVGVVYWQSSGPNANNILIGYFRFGVRRSPVSLSTAP